MEAIIFDLDGVLVDSMPAHVRAWQAAFESGAGVKVTQRDIYLLEGMWA
ncbi:MAG: HAD family hydrolase [Nitrososphaera sp.]